MAIGTIVIVLLVLAVGMATQPVSGLTGIKEEVNGQVVRAEQASIGGRAIGLVLAVERTTAEEAEAFDVHSELIVAPGADPSSWLRFDLTGGAVAIAAGDVDADGHDDVAIAFQQEGPPCPTPVVGQTPCGVIRVFDGLALLEGRLLMIAQVDIAPASSTCPPSTHAPSALAFGDVTGDGRAELAFTQLGMSPNTCGTVHVFPGSRLAGRVGMDHACASLQGERYLPGGHPDQFGATLELFAVGTPPTPYLAVGAPFSPNGTVAMAGRLQVLDIGGACGSFGGMPSIAFDHRGTTKGELAGADAVFADETLWVAAKGRLDAFRTPGFDRTQSFSPPIAYPLAAPGDFTDDGRSEILVGPRLMTPEGKVILYLDPFADQTFRGTFIGRDSVLSSDRFGLRLWSLDDVWNPHLTLHAKPNRVLAGQVVNVSVAELLSLVPDAGKIELQPFGGTVVEHGAQWVLIRAGGPGQVIVQGRVLETTATVRVPVDPRPDQASLVAPDSVRTLQPFVARVYAPEGSSVAWEAPSGSPGSGVGNVVEARYNEPGSYQVTARVLMPDGVEEVLRHRVDVLSGPPIAVTGPGHVVQGVAFSLRVWEPQAEFEYVWQLEGAQIGLVTMGGPAIGIPAGGWGTVNATVVARDPDGRAVQVGHHRVTIENLPPEIRSVEAKAQAGAHGLVAKANVVDPGGDPFTIKWYIDDGLAGEGAALHVPGLVAGWINVTVVATDESGLSSTARRTVHVVDPWRVANESLAPRDPSQASGFGSPELWKPIERIEGRGEQEASATPAIGAVIVAGAFLVPALLWRRRVG